MFQLEEIIFMQLQEKKEEIWLSPMTKAPKPKENPKNIVIT